MYKLYIHIYGAPMEPPMEPPISRAFDGEVLAVLEVEAQDLFLCMM